MLLTIYYRRQKKVKEKTIKINSEPHSIIKDYCKKNGLKLARFIENACLHYIKEATRGSNNEKDL